MADKDAAVVEKKSGSLLPIINLVLLILVLGVGGFIAWKIVQMEQPPVVTQEAGSSAETEMPVPEDDDPGKPPVFLDIADVTINLADADESRFLRAKIKLELRNEESKAVIEPYLVQINDMVITLLSSKTFAEIRTPQGKYDLKEDLVYRMNRVVPGKPIKNLYFTDFVSQ